MKSIERFRAWRDGQAFDRMPIRHLGELTVNEKLRKYFGLKKDDKDGLLCALGDDFREIYPAFRGPAELQGIGASGHGVVNCAVFRAAMQAAFPGKHPPLADLQDIGELPGRFVPSTDWLDYSGISAQCEKYKDYVRIAGYCDYDFLNGLGELRGVEQGYIDIAMREQIYLDLIDLRFSFGYENLERTLEAANGAIDVVHFGDDLGTQLGLLISPEDFMELFAEIYRRSFALAHRYGAMTMMHVCGSIKKMIPYLAGMGLDILDVVQTNAAGMELEGLKREYGGIIRFAGSMCVQELLPYGSVERVRAETERRQELFRDGGLIFGPSHHIQPGTPLENILEMYRSAGGLREKRGEACAY